MKTHFPQFRVLDNSMEILKKYFNLHSSDYCQDGAIVFDFVCTLRFAPSFLVPTTTSVVFLIDLYEFLICPAY